MASRLLAAALLLLLLGIGGPLGRAARATAAVKPGPGTVGIIAGDVDGAAIRAASDLARVLGDGYGLRVIPIAGEESLENIEDLMGTGMIDVAIVQADAMARYLQMKRNPGAETRLQYIAKLYSEDFHVLSRMQFLCLGDLKGRRVSFGPRNSGTAITAEAVFQANNISVEPVYLDHEEAIARLKSGALDAMAYTGGRPSRAFEGITYKDRVHFLDVEYLPQLRGAYLPGIMTAQDYPKLIAPNESVASIGVSSVMLVRDWPVQSERFRTLSRFVESFFASFDKLRSGAFSPKWREVDLRAPMKGWRRFEAASKWLAANPQAADSPVTSSAAAQLQVMLRKFVQSRGGGINGQEDLFDQFVQWYRQQPAQQ